MDVGFGGPPETMERRSGRPEWSWTGRLDPGSCRLPAATRALYVIRKRNRDESTSKRQRKRSLSETGSGIGMAAVLTGCAGPELHREAVTGSDLREARKQMNSEPLPAEKGTAGYEQHAMVKRVEKRIRPATRKVCRQTLDEQTCRTRYAKIKVSVKPEDEKINTYADIDGNVVFHGGLVCRAGSEDEIAGVMGHEMAHVLLRHNEKSSANQTMGMVVGGLIGANGSTGGGGRAQGRGRLHADASCRRHPDRALEQHDATDPGGVESAGDQAGGRSEVGSTGGAAPVHEPVPEVPGMPAPGASRVDEPSEASGAGGEGSVSRIAGPMPGALRGGPAPNLVLMTGGKLPSIGDSPRRPRGFGPPERAGGRGGPVRSAFSTGG